MVINEFVYEQNNVVTRREFSTFFGNGGEEVAYAYRYDENPNPYYGNVALLIRSGDWMRYLSENNIVEEQYENEAFRISYIYEYNVEGYPTRITHPDVDTETELTYQCVAHQ